MCDEPIVSVVVPTYNEADNLPVLVSGLHAVLSPSYCYEVVVVDDDSPDGTWRVAEGLSRLYPVRVIRRRGERGLGTAIVRGIREARGKYIVVMDADLQHPPEEVPRLVELLEEGYDVVIASRYARGGGAEDWSVFRKLLSRAATLLAHFLLAESRRTSDPMSGFFAVRRELAESLELEGRSWKVLLEILVKAPWARVAEHPYVFRNRYRGESKLGLGAMIDYVRDLLRLSGYRPLRFALVGLSGTVVNLAALWLLHGVFSLPLWAGLPLAWETSLTWNYSLHDKWTFRGKRGERGPRGWLRYWARYHLAALSAEAAYLSLGYGLAALGLHYIASALLGILAGWALNYTVSQYRVWRLHEPRRL